MSRKNKKNTKRSLFLSLLTGLVILGGIAFTLSSTQLFKGDWGGIGIGITENFSFVVTNVDGGYVNGLQENDFRFFTGGTTERWPSSFGAWNSQAWDPEIGDWVDAYVYQVSIIQGDYEVEVDAPGYEIERSGPFTTTETDFPLGGDFTYDIVLDFATEGDRFDVNRLFIKDQAENFISGLSKTDFEIPADSPDYSFNLSTTAEPMYELEGLDEGAYNYTVTKSGYVSSTQSITVTDGVDHFESVTLPSAYLIEVRDSTSSLATNATVRVDQYDCDHLENLPGRYHCVVPPTTAIRTYSISLDGHHSTVGVFSENRDSHDDPQVTASIRMESSDSAILDTDQDGLGDGDEIVLHGTDPTIADTDGDGLSDGDEVNLTLTDPLDTDTDDDGLDDGAEVNTHATDPLDIDTDRDTLNDGEEINTHGTDPTDKDTDDDGLDDDKEIIVHATDPLDADTDGGGVEDGQEVNTDTTDPLDASDDLTPVEEEACKKIEVSADITEIDSRDDDEDLEIEITVELDLPADWEGTLVFESENGGEFDDRDGRSRERLELNVSGDDDAVVVDFSGADPNIGNEITVSLLEEDCEYVIEFTDEDDDRAPECDDPFLDTGDNDEWPGLYICPMYQADIVDGKTRTSFAPWDLLTRAEWLKIILRTAGYDEDDADDLQEGFIDVHDYDWYSDYVKIAEDLDVIRMDDFGRFFNPDAPITRGDAILYTVRLAEETLFDWDRRDIPFDDLLESYYATYAVIIAHDTIVSVPGDGNTPVVQGYGDDTFRPYNYMTRAEAMTIAYRASLAWLEDMGGPEIEF